MDDTVILRLDVHGVLTNLAMGDDQEIGQVLPDEVLSGVLDGRLELFGPGNAVVDHHYVPGADVDIRVRLADPHAKRCNERAITVVANQFGETVEPQEYKALRSAVAGQGRSLWTVSLAEARELARTAPAFESTPVRPAFVGSTFDQIVQTGNMVCDAATWPYSAKPTESVPKPPGQEFPAALVELFGNKGRTITIRDFEPRRLPDVLGRHASEMPWDRKIDDFCYGRYQVSKDWIESSRIRANRGVEIIPLIRFSRVALAYHAGSNYAKRIEASETIGTLDDHRVRVYVAEGTAEADHAKEHVSGAQLFLSPHSIERTIRDVLIEPPVGEIEMDSVVMVDMLTLLNLIREGSGKEIWDPSNGQVEVDSDRHLIRVEGKWHGKRPRQEVEVSLHVRLLPIAIAARNPVSIYAGIPYRRNDVRWARMLEEALATERMNKTMNHFFSLGVFQNPDLYGVQAA